MGDEYNEFVYKAGVGGQGHHYWADNQPHNLPKGFRPHGEPAYDPTRADAPYGRDTAGDPLHGPLQYEDYRPGAQWPTIDADRGWQSDIPRLNALGFHFESCKGKGAYGVSHPHVVSIESVVHVRDQTTGFRSLFVCVFMELCDGDLEGLVGTGRLNEDQSHEWFTQIACALHYLHTNRISHMDIKPPNILYGHTGADQWVYKLADFGLALAFGPNEPMRTANKIGTFIYMAPEMRRIFWGLRKRPKDFAVSLVGTVVPYEHIYNYASLPGLRVQPYIYDYLVKTKYFPANYPLIQLLYAMTEEGPTRRCPLDQVLQHQWVTNPVLY